MEELDTWELIQKNQFDAACKKADAEYDKSGNVLHLRNKVFALLHLKKYQESIVLSQEIIRIRMGETDSDFIFCGIAMWLTGTKQEAVQTWLMGNNCKYSDAAGGIELQSILYYASVFMEDEILKNESIKRIKKMLKSKKSVSWPGPIGSYILNAIPETVLLSNLSDIPILKERQLCQVNFFRAIKKFELQDPDWKKDLIYTLKMSPSTYLEPTYYLSIGQLNEN